MSARESMAAINQPVRSNVARGSDRILNVPRCSMYRAAALNIATGAGQAISWDTLDYDTDGMTAVSATTGFFITCRTAGLYAVTAWVLWTSNATSFRQMQFSKNGGSMLLPDSVIQPIAGVVTGQQIYAHIAMVAGDVVDVVVGQSTGGNLAISVATASARENGFQACLISL